MSSMDQNVHIIGGGISGLGCAHYLDKEGISSIVFEENTSVGGKAGFKYNGDRCLEIGGKNFSSTWPLFNKLLDEFAIREFDDQHVSHHILMKGKIVSFTRNIKLPDSLQMLINLGFKSIFQLKNTLKFIKTHRDEINYYNGLIESIEKEYDNKTITSYFNKKLTHSLFRMSSIIMGGAEPEETYYSTLVNLLKTATEGGTHNAIKGGTHHSIRGGIGRFFKSLSEPHDIRLETKINKILIEDNKVIGLEVSKENKKETILVNRVVSSVPLNNLKSMIDFPEDIQNEINKIRYFPVAIIIAEYEEDIFDETINSIMFDNSFHLGHCSANRLTEKNVIRFTLAGKKARAVMSKSDDELIELVEKEFNSVRPITSKRVFYSAQRHIGGICAYGPNYSKARKKITDYIQKIEGLEIAGDYLEGHNLEHCLISAKTAAQKTINLTRVPFKTKTIH